MQYLLNRFFIVIAILFIVLGSSCSLFPTKPEHYDNVCSLLDDRISWYKSLKYIEEKYQVDMSLILAFIKQESSFDAYARPARTTALGFIPWSRESSAYGYAQAKDETWDWYKQDSGNNSHSRDEFADAAEFVAWYVNKTYKMNSIAKTDTYNQYLAYHEGHKGFKNKSYASKIWLLNVAKKVQNTANNYARNLQGCRNTLDNTFSWRYF